MKIGDVLVCVDDQFKPSEFHFIPNRPVKGCVYTIREFEARGGRGLGIRLCELSNPLVEVVSGKTGALVALMEPPFHVRRFRPAKPTDISELTSLLKDPVPV